MRGLVIVQQRLEAKSYASCCCCRFRSCSPALTCTLVILCCGVEGDILGDIDGDCDVIGVCILYIVVSLTF